MNNSAVEHRLLQIGADGSRTSIARSIAIEAPVAIEINGIGYAVLMGTPTDLEDLAFGFAQSERLIDAPEDVVSVEAHDSDVGTILRIWLVQSKAERTAERVRHRVSESSCGLCGIENLEQALRPLPAVSARSDADDHAVFAALEKLCEQQPLSARTGAVHAAALCAADGTIRLVREDVGRHNAFDKLIGAMLRQGLDWDGGFALLSARCSYELVEKAALANCPLLVAISAPTSLALDRAKQCGLQLRILARHDSMLSI